MRLARALTLCVTLAASTPAFAGKWLETPYTPEQIHDACGDGTKMSLLFVDAKGARVIRDMVFHDASDKRVVVQSMGRDDTGAVIEPEEDKTYTWVELQRHARYRPEQATRARSEFETRLGHFEGWVYDVSEVGPDGSPMQTRLWFADRLPGPPLRMEVRVGETTVMTMEVMSRAPMPTTVEVPEAVDVPQAPQAVDAAPAPDAPAAPSP